ncbi:YuiB family protein [Bacillaceae bacterium W0354]
MGVLILVIEALLFFVLFFGIAFILNMLLRSTWIMSIVFPIVVILIVDDVSFWSYFSSPGTAFPMLWDSFINLQVVDIVILMTGFVGTIVAGIVIKILRKSGYQMF